MVYYKKRLPKEKAFGIEFPERILIYSFKDVKSEQDITNIENEEGFIGWIGKKPQSIN